MEDAGEERAETFALNGAAGGERERAHRAAMKSAMEGDELVALGVIFHQLNGRFDRFGAGISEVDALRCFAGRDRGELLGKFDEIRIIEIRARHVDQF